MSSQKEVIAFLKAISGQANILTIPRIYIDIFKSHRTALLISQCVYWSDKTKDPEGWFYKTFAEWQAELGMNQHAIETSRDALIDFGVLDFTLMRQNGTHKNHWRVNFERLYALLSEQLDLAETAKPDLAENYKPSLSTKTTPKTTLSRSRAKDPRTDSPQITAYRDVTHRRPNITIYDFVIEKIGHLSADDIRPLFVEWAARGYNPNSAKWLEWIETGIPVQIGKRANSNAAQEWLAGKESGDGLLDVFQNL